MVSRQHATLVSGSGGGGHRGLGLHLHVAGVDDEAAAAREVCVHVWQLK